MGKFSFGSFGFMLNPIGVIGSLLGSALGARYLSGVSVSVGSGVGEMIGLAVVGTSPVIFDNFGSRYL